MKYWIIRTIILAALSTAVLPAQDITGTWQGTLAPPSAKQELRVVFKVSKDGSGLAGLMYSIDQGPQSFACAVTIAAGNLKVSVPSISGVYEGKLDSDGVNLTGTWTQAGGPGIPLNLKHTGPKDPEWVIPEPPAAPKPMPADANPTFDAASIKPSDPATQGRAFQIRGREFHAINASANSLMVFIWGLHARQITGAPAWLESDKYDIVAKPDLEGMPSQKQWKNMVEKMLADRFKLTYHREKRELQVYAIQLGKNGQKLTKSAGDPNGLPSLFFRGLGNLPAANATMEDFAGVMQSAVMERPVVDQTGLQGRWDFVLTWTPDETQFASLGVKVPPPSDKPDAPPDLATAMQSELGLKLVATKAMVDVIVVDHVEKPTAN